MPSRTSWNDLDRAATRHLGDVRDVGPIGAGGRGRLSSIEQSGQERIQVLRRELIGSPVAFDAGHDNAGPMQQVTLHPRRVEILTGLEDRQCGCRGRQSDAGASFGVKHAVSVYEIARALGKQIFGLQELPEPLRVELGLDQERPDRMNDPPFDQLDFQTA